MYYWKLRAILQDQKCRFCIGMLKTTTYTSVDRESKHILIPFSGKLPLGQHKMVLELEIQALLYLKCLIYPEYFGQIMFSWPSYYFQYFPQYFSLSLLLCEHRADSVDSLILARSRIQLLTDSLFNQTCYFYLCYLYICLHLLLFPYFPENDPKATDVSDFIADLMWTLVHKSICQNVFVMYLSCHKAAVM